eukprot:scaffold300689_cov57-Attheya_sp.AAC.2
MVVVAPKMQTVTGCLMFGIIVLMTTTLLSTTRAFSINAHSYVAPRSRIRPLCHSICTSSNNGWNPTTITRPRSLILHSSLWEDDFSEEEEVVSGVKRAASHLMDDDDDDDDDDDLIRSSPNHATKHTNLDAPNYDGDDDDDDDDDTDDDYYQRLFQEQQTDQGEGFLPEDEHDTIQASQEEEEERAYEAERRYKEEQTVKAEWRAKLRDWNEEAVRQRQVRRLERKQHQRLERAQTWASNYTLQFSSSPNHHETNSRDQQQQQQQHDNAVQVYTRFLDTLEVWRLEGQREAREYVADQEAQRACSSHTISSTTTKLERPMDINIRKERRTQMLVQMVFQPDELLQNANDDEDDLEVALQHISTDDLRTALQIRGNVKLVAAPKRPKLLELMKQSLKSDLF